MGLKIVLSLPPNKADPADTLDSSVRTCLAGPSGHLRPMNKDPGEQNQPNRDHSKRSP